MIRNLTGPIYFKKLKAISSSKPAKTPLLNEFYDYFGNINSSNDAENININPNLDQNTDRIINSPNYRTGNIKKKLFVGYIDFSRCFNTIHQAKLFQKLVQAGVNGKLIRIVKIIYEYLKTSVHFI